MKIGLTYDLRSAYLAAGYGEEETAEFDRDDTVDAIEQALTDLGHVTERIGNVIGLVEKLAAGSRWDLVFNIAEGLMGIGREAQVPALLDAYGIAYTFSDPLVMALTLHKALTKHVVRDAGIPTSSFQVVEGPHDAEIMTFPPPFFVKPVAEGTGKGITAHSIVSCLHDLPAACKHLLSAYRQPVLVEPYLSGREFTVALIGSAAQTRVLGTMEVHLLENAESGVYSYINKERSEELVEYRLLRPEESPLIEAVENIARDAWLALGCRDAGRVDIRCDADGRPQFMEVNPLAGLHPQHSDLPIICNLIGMPYRQLIQEIVASASERIPHQHNEERLQARCA